MFLMAGGKGIWDNGRVRSGALYTLGRYEQLAKILRTHLHRKIKQ